MKGFTAVLKVMVEELSLMENRSLSVRLSQLDDIIAEAKTLKDALIEQEINEPTKGE
jgi:hypothetical protein